METAVTVSASAYGLIVFWYCIIVASIVFYAMLDGFDLGVGALHLFVSSDEERRIFLNAIGPVWDGNEVWLVILVGGLFAGFPLAYATLLSAFYIPLTFLIFGLVFRAVAIEFRSKVYARWWRSLWDKLFFLASVLIALEVGMALGNLVMGVPLDKDFVYVGNHFLTFFRPYALLVGLLTLALFTMHGTIYLIMKTENALQERVKRWIQPSLIFFFTTYFLTTVVTLIYQEHMAVRIRERPYLFFVVLLHMLVIATIPHQIYRQNYGRAFLSSCLNIAFLLVLFALGTFPDLIRSSFHPLENSIHVEVAAASLKTLKVLSVIVAIGIPFVLAYSFFIYRLFRGKVRLDHASY